MMDYDFDLETDTVHPNFCSDQVALARWIQRALLTERNTYPQYTESYGVEFEHLKGSPQNQRNFLLANVQKTIEEALSTREEIKTVDNFNFEDVPGQPDAISITFQVHTVYGELHQNFIWKIL